MIQKRAQFYTRTKCTKKGSVEFLEYVNIPITIKKSTIKGAGMGAFATEPIKKGWMSPYFGKPKGYDNMNGRYSWEIFAYDPFTGDSYDSDEEGYEVLFYVDASDKKYSNWTRYVNTTLKESKENLKPRQIFDKIYYIAKRDIKPGEELFIDYGKEYKKQYLAN